MKRSTRVDALTAAIKQAGKTLALLGMLALFGLAGAGASVAHIGLNGRLIAPGPVTTPPPYIAASNGDILIGTTVAATNGVRIAAKTGDVHVGS
jgi:hypothetical protein